MDYFDATRHLVTYYNKHYNQNASSLKEIAIPECHELYSNLKTNYEGLVVKQSNNETYSFKAFPIRTGTLYEKKFSLEVFKHFDFSILPYVGFQSHFQGFLSKYLINEITVKLCIELVERITHDTGPIYKLHIPRWIEIYRIIVGDYSILEHLFFLCQYRDCRSDTTKNK